MNWLDEARTRRTFIYKTNVAVAPSSIALAVAPFEVVADDSLDYVTHYWIPSTARSSSSSMTTSKSSVALTSGGSVRGLLNHSISCIPQIFKIYEKYLEASYPFESYKQIFVDDYYMDSMPFAGYSTLFPSVFFVDGEIYIVTMYDDSMSIFASSMMCDSTVIDQSYIIWQAIAYDIAYSWLGSTIRLKSHADR
jgi:hypothetical protein